MKVWLNSHEEGPCQTTTDIYCMNSLLSAQRELQPFTWLIEKKRTVKDMENYHTSPIRVVAYKMPEIKSWPMIGKQSVHLVAISPL